MIGIGATAVAALAAPGTSSRLRKTVLSHTVRLFFLQLLAIDLMLLLASFALQLGCDGPGPSTANWLLGLNIASLVLLSAFLLYHAAYCVCVGVRSYVRDLYLVVELIIVIIALAFKARGMAAGNTSMSGAVPFGLIIALFVLMTLMRMRKLQRLLRAKATAAREAHRRDKAAVFMSALAAKSALDAALAKDPSGASLGPAERLVALVLNTLSPDGAAAPIPYPALSMPAPEQV